MTFRSPEQVSEDLGHISPHTIRRLVREGKIACTKLARGKFVFTDGQVDAMIAHLEAPAKTPAKRGPSSLGPTARSAASRRGNLET